MPHEKEKTVEFLLCTSSAPVTACDENECSIKKMCNSHVRGQLSDLFLCLLHWPYKGNFALSIHLFMSKHKPVPTSPPDGFALIVGRVSRERAA